MNYSQNSHSHCYENQTPPCGLKGYHCCLCNIVTSGGATKRKDCPNSQPEVPEWEKEFDKQFCEDPKNPIYLAMRYWRNWNKHDWNMIPTVSEVKSFVQEIINQTIEEAAEALEKEKSFRIKQIPNHQDSVIEACNKKDINKLIFLWQHSLTDEHNDSISSAQTTIRQLKK